MITPIVGDARHVLPGLPDACIDAIITDPPYELGFMDKTWDRTGVAYDVAMWTECLRVLKPGGHLAAFGGTRTYHRMACAVEDAGFEIRDSLTWLYGSGFPKSLDVSKSIDKARDDKPDILRVTSWLADHAARAGVTRAQVDEHMGTSDMGGWWLSRLPHRCQVPTWEQWQRLRELLGLGDEMDAEVWRLNGRKGTPGEAWATAEILRTEDRHNEPSGIVNAGQGARTAVTREIKAANTDAARTWAGWGTALKPAVEPIVLARKPLQGAVAANVLAHGVGGLNIDATRVGWDAASLAKDTARRAQPRTDITGGRLMTGEAGAFEGVTDSPPGRWPANVLLSHGEECDGVCVAGCPVAELDTQSGTLKSGEHAPHHRRHVAGGNGSTHGAMAGVTGQSYADQGGASRYFPTFRYQAKAPSRERVKINGVSHPTVKPIALMQWLVRLLCPPGGTVLDPFVGSGTTIEACMIEGMRVIGIESDPQYVPHILHRIDRAWTRRPLA